MKNPNIILLLSDNLGFGELGCYGGGILRGAPTPNLDLLASQGLRLLNMNMESQCTPSRSALMTGRFPYRSGTSSITQPGLPGGLVQWEKTIAEVLSDNGYATAHFGKWHLGNIAGRHPQDRGFDEWWGIVDTHDTVMWDTSTGYDPLEVGRESLYEGKKGESSRVIATYDLERRATFDQEVFSRTEDFVKRQAQANRPFFAYVPLAFPHFPVIPHPDFAGRTGVGDFADGLVELDSRVGHLMKVVEELGIREETIFIFTSDNGVEETLPSRGWTGPWGGSYFTAMEGCLRVPCLIRWDGHIPAGSESMKMVHAVDLFSTIASWANAAIPDDRPIDGIDMSQQFSGQPDAPEREGFPVYVGDRLHAVKWKNWKMHFVWQEYMYDPPQQLGLPRLHNLYDDPRERNNVLLPKNAWVRIPVGKLLNVWFNSLKNFPPIPAGTPDPYLPPQPKEVQS